MQSMRNSIEYFLYSQLNQFRSFFAYRTQAIAWVLFEFVLTALNFATITVIYDISSGIAGWSYFQMLFLSSVTSLFASALWYFANPEGLVRSMREGRLDVYLAKPYGLMTLAISNFGNPSSLFGVFSSSVLLMYAVSHLQFGPLQLALYLVLFVAGVITFSLFILLLSAFSYIVMKSASFVGRFMDTAESLVRYPLSIYGAPIQFIFSILVPIGIASYYPTETLLGRVDLPVYLGLLAFSLLMAYISRRLFYQLMKRYTSGGG